MRGNIFLLTTLLIFGYALSAPTQHCLVIASTGSTNRNERQGSTNIFLRPEIYEMDITAHVSNRFAKTVLVSKVKNSHKCASETTFSVVLPERAFISEFVMEIGGKRYKAYVKEKEEAKNAYYTAVAMGQSAAHVFVSARDSNRFTVSVNIEPESKAVFLLSYEELLQRKNDKYELVINIHPGQIVQNLNVKVTLDESRTITFVKTPCLRSGNEIGKNDEKLDPLSEIDIINPSTYVVKFSPDPNKQKKFARLLNTRESKGLSGQFIVQYDVERDHLGGEVLLQDGYFVHFFAPDDLKPLPKHVIFVLDTSGSMMGRKIEQLKDAMKSILSEINEGDFVNIIEFSRKVLVRDISAGTHTFVSCENYEEPFNTLEKLNLPAPTKVTSETLRKAKSIVGNMIASGTTNMIVGLETALYLVKVGQENIDDITDKKHQPIIIFLTDGAPNVGVSSEEEIVRIITGLNSRGNNVPIYSLSFGYGANKEFLRKLSLKNQGFSRHIYEASDASLQLQEFYKQISTPLLLNIKFKYNSEVKDVTKSKFPIYYGGSEIVVTGRYEASKSSFWAPVVCQELTGVKMVTPTIGNPVTSLERLWAYLTVKQTLEERDLADNKAELTEKALDLALKYSFVTKITSLVVVKPNDNVVIDTEEAGKEENADGENSDSLYKASTLRPRVVTEVRGAYGPPQYPALQYSQGFATETSVPQIKHMKYIPGSRLEYVLPWLSSAINPNGTITVLRGIYDLGEYATVSINPECPKTPLRSTETGICTLLKDCPQVYFLLTHFQVYQQYFCPLNNKFAGVCCPKNPWVQ